MNIAPEQHNLAALTAPWANSRRLAGHLPVSGISTDSRRIRPGDVFIAIKGFQQDGHQFIAEAVEAGAVAIVYQDPSFRDAIPEGISAVLVDNSRRAAAHLAAEFWGHPSHSLTLVGATGTNGKTTVAYMMDSIWRAGGASTGLLTTPARMIAGRELPADRTTPDAVQLQKLLAQMRQEEVSHVCLEVSSHGLALDRTWLCKFDGAIFTNLTQDHLDFHHNLEDYFAAKLRLFTDYAELAAPEKSMVGAINIDDAAGQRITQQAKCQVVSYGVNNQAEVTASEVRIEADGIDFKLHLPEDQIVPVSLPLTGSFNLYNALGAAACAWGMGIGTEQIAAGLAQLQTVPGRFERVDEGQDFTVIVDYAHTPDALDNVLSAARSLHPERLLCVFGCGGDRDRSKRLLMGKIGTEQADFAIITSDNPRSEDPSAIIEEIAAGAEGNNYTIQPDRRQAIYEAVSQARSGDIVVIAGKGHETYQIFADRRVPFDDRQVAREALRETLG